MVRGVLARRCMTNTLHALSWLDEDLSCFLARTLAVLKVGRLVFAAHLHTLFLSLIRLCCLSCPRLHWMHFTAGVKSLCHT